MSGTQTLQKTCMYCPTEFMNWPHYKSHMKIAHPPESRRLECSECPRVFKTGPAYIRHFRAHHDPEEVLRRFWEKVEKTGDCWLWTGAITNHGYGRFSYPGGGWARAHRYSYELHVGPIPEGKVLDHLCRNPACVNPTHLEAVEHAENIRRGYEAIGILDCPRCDFSTTHGGALASHLRWKHPGVTFSHDRGSIPGKGFGAQAVLQHKGKDDNG